MNKELKLQFENELKEHLTIELSSYKNISVLKNEIKIKKTKDNNAHGSIVFDYLVNARGYVLTMSAMAPEFDLFVNEVSPPYGSNILSEYTLAMSSSGEKTKSFSYLVGGAIPFPQNTEKFKETISWISEKVTSIYLPRVFHLLNFDSLLISDVLDNPQDYSYPFLLILYVLKKNNLDFSTVDENILFSKKISKNSSFDKSTYMQYINPS